MPQFHKKTTEMTVNLRKLEGFKKEEQLVFILAHIRDIAWTHPKEMEKLAEKFPEIKGMSTNHNLLRAEIYETIFNQQSFAENHDAHYGREIQKIGDAIERITAACYKEKAKMIGPDPNMTKFEKDIIKQDKKDLREIKATSEEGSDHIDEMDLTTDEEHVVTGNKKKKASVRKPKKTPKAKNKSETKQPKNNDVKVEPPMCRPFIMIPSKMRPQGPQGQ